MKIVGLIFFVVTLGSVLTILWLHAATAMQYRQGPQGPTQGTQGPKNPAPTGNDKEKVRR